MQQDTHIITGTVERIIFHNSENGYIVFVISHEQAQQQTTACGHALPIRPGEQVELTGTWATHPKFGRQFHIDHCTVTLPITVVGLKKYLSSGLIKGIGPAYADKLIEQFGDQVLTVIDKHPERLKQISGIGPKRIESILEAWKSQKAISNIMVFLQEKGISPAYASKIYKHYGAHAIAVIQENPYRLADDIWGIGFKIADTIAHNLGIASNSPKRIKAGILFALSTHIGYGHLYATVTAIKETTCKLLGLAPTDEVLLKNALHELYNEDKIKVISYHEEHYLALTLHYHTEKGIAQNLLRLLDYPIREFPINDIYQTLRNDTSDIVLTEDQQRGILSCLQHKVTVITGGPGTGKTTLIKKLLTVLDKQRCTYRLAAPTGRAAKRITESTGHAAVTLHRLLEFDPSNMQFTKTEHNALQLDFLIVDEASMIDLFLASALIKALPLQAQVVFIGDVDQLPSVGAGNILYDLIASSKITCIRLNTIFRQAQDSLIITNAHRINQGLFPVSYLPDSRKDFLFIKENEPALVNNHLHTIVTQWLGQKKFTSSDMIVLVPMNRGIVGTYKINHDLQQIINPAPDDNAIVYAGTTFKHGDRVMQVRNNYEKFVFNGDIGFITAINQPEQTITITYADRPLVYEISELDEIVLAYAISIHKSQGSEYPVVIVPLFMQHFTLLQRNLVYTAITRAKKWCIFIGQPKALAIAIKNTKGSARTTFLSQFLTTDLSCR